MSRSARISLLVALALSAPATMPAAAAHDALPAPVPGRVPALVVGQGPGVGLPTVAAALAGKPSHAYGLFVQAGVLPPQLLLSGVLAVDGTAEHTLALPAEVLDQPLVFRVAVLEGRSASFSPDAPLQLGTSGDCRIEDWEDHDCGTGAGCDDGDGDSPSAPGQIITCQWEDEWGCVSATNDSPDGPHLAVIFDSANPTGGDLDLGTPIAGPEQCQLGDGFVVGAHPCTAYGHVLIVQENADGCDDGFCDVPDDEGWGGTINLWFPPFPGRAPCWMDLLDVDDPGGATVRTYCDLCGPDPIDDLFVPPGADHSLTRVYFSQKCVTRVEVSFAGSGAIAEWAYEFCNTPQ